MVLNAAPAQPLPGELLDVIDVLIVNEDELTLIAGQGGSVAQRLESVDVPCAVVTLGPRGCCARADGQFFEQPAYRVASVDTTAAGDTFCGVLVASLRSRAALPQGLRRAAAAAALATTRAGAQASIPTYAEVEALKNSVPDNENDPVRSELRAYCGLQPSKRTPAD